MLTLAVVFEVSTPLNSQSATDPLLSATHLRDVSIMTSTQVNANLFRVSFMC